MKAESQNNRPRIPLTHTDGFFKKLVEKEAIRFALEQTDNNKARAAKMLNINRTLLYKKIAKHNIPLKQDNT